LRDLEILCKGVNGEKKKGVKHSLLWFGFWGGWGGPLFSHQLGKKKRGTLNTKKNKKA